MSVKTAVSPLTIEELANQARHMISYSLHNKIKPMVAVVVQSSGDGWQGAMMVLYASQTEPDPRGQQSMPLTPFFYPYQVATLLFEYGVITEQHVSQKTGIQVHWCNIAEGFVI